MSPARSEHRDSFPRSRWWTQCGCCGYRFIDLNSPRGFLAAFFDKDRLALAFRLPARVLGMLALALVEGSLSASPPRGWAGTGTVGIGMSPSKPGMGQMKLSKARVQAIKV
jgi:hypothetical protein